MSVQPINRVAYSLTQPLLDVFPAPIASQRAPTGADKAPIGQSWVVVPLNDYYVLTSIVNNVATWQLIASGGGSLNTITTNAGVVAPVAGNINLFGGGSTNITTTGAGATATVAVIASPSFAGTVTAATGFTATTGNIVASTGNITATLGNIAATAGSLSAGTTVTAGTGITSTTGNITASAGNIIATAGSVSANTTVTAGTNLIGTLGLTVSAFTAGVAQTNGAGVFSSTKGTDGQILISSTAGVPVWAAITAGTNVTITNASNSITINAAVDAQVVDYVTTAVTPYVVGATDYYISIDASGGAKQVNLPNAPATGRIFVVKDKNGNAGANNITVTTVGGVVTIDGATTDVFTTNFESSQYIFNGTSYEVY